jgi:ferredoxin-NADP reductase
MARAALRGRLIWRVATLASTRSESATARTLAFDVPDWPGHLAGQHVDVRLTAPDGYSTQRSYSIASAWDAADPILGLTVELVDDGEVSPFLVGVLQVGQAVELRGPIGGWFAWEATDPGPVLLIGGGSGVVPLMAMIRARALAGSRAPFRLIYSVRAPEAALYDEELARLAGAGTGLEVEHVYTRAAPPEWAGPVGRITPGQVRLAAAHLRAQGTIFVCGPTGFVEAVAAMLTSGGVDPGRIRTERFGPSGG